ncbi:MAG: KH domain-containing protein [Candidatus Heimdallarchaeota archaeon]|nr:KH domain-containing protein [Candidatus Heimdallarchaeota archaeon]MCK5047810.1 KH domain-containing protein [Candidatus Heimdallarchaeota archaeon]
MEIPPLQPIKLANNELNFINEFYSYVPNNVNVIDCHVFFERKKVVFIVGPGQAGYAVGKGGKNVQLIQNQLKMDVQIIEYSTDFYYLLENIFFPIHILSIKTSPLELNQWKIDISIPNKELNAIKNDNKWVLERAYHILRKHSNCSSLTVNRLTFI